VHCRDRAILNAARRVAREMAAGARVADCVELVTRRELKNSAPRFL
jgi:hypothetical protein